MEPMAMLGEILTRGFTQHRDVTRHFAQLARAVENPRRLPTILGTTANFGLNAVYHARFQSLRPAFADATIKILSVDPPYVYAKSSDGRYRSRSARSLECDSAGRGEAISLVIDLLRDWLPTLAPGGVLLLWQPVALVAPEIAAAIDDYGWELERLVVWDKLRPQPGAFDSPYSNQCEHLLVLKRRGDVLINHDNSPRGNVLRFLPVSRPGLAEFQEHGFEKPVDLCRFLVGKHSFAAELVVDLCGCTGSMSVAAIEMNRRWLYVESSSANFEVGSRRIGDALASQQARAS
jgi:DNA modification methylase